MDRDKAQELLEAARVAQTLFWDALLELEHETGVEIDSNLDLADSDLDTLLENSEESV